MSTTLNSSSSTGILKRCGSSYGTNNEQRLLLKRIKMEDGVSPDDAKSLNRGNSLTLMDAMSSSGKSPTAGSTSGTELAKKTKAEAESKAAVKLSAGKADGTTINSSQQSFEAISQVSNTNTESNDSLSATASSVKPMEEPIPAGPPPQQANAVEEPEVVPLKSTHFRHLHHKYSSELEYMLREFQKLESQLLGAKAPAGAAVSAESTASRERREKLHSFILHLEDTFQQIVTGLELEMAGKSTCPTSARTDTGLSSNLTREKEDEENVQKLEEHILANLLPVKVRLKKQLSAQQGAKHNPAGMPVVRGGGMVHADNKKATFLKAAVEPPRPAYVPPTRRASQLGVVQNGGGSSLTQKLLGSSTGSNDDQANRDLKEPAKGTALPVDGAISKEKPKVLFAGMALGSSQIESSVTAATSVHHMEIKCPTLLKVRSEAHLAILEDSYAANDATSDAIADLWPTTGSIDERTALSDEEDDFDEPDHIYSKHGTQLSLAAHAAILSYEEKRKARRRRRRKKKLLLLQQQQQQQQRQQQQAAQAAAVAAAAVPKRKKIVKKRGPRNVEYLCALCNEVYNSTCDYNPWWALTQQDCPKCGKLQVRKTVEKHRLATYSLLWAT
jgi:hypothetical protein